jgi:spore germination protein GerM
MDVHGIMVNAHILQDVQHIINKNLKIAKVYQIPALVTVLIVLILIPVPLTLMRFLVQALFNNRTVIGIYKNLYV